MDEGSRGRTAVLPDYFVAENLVNKIIGDKIFNEIVWT